MKPGLLLFILLWTSSVFAQESIGDSIQMEGQRLYRSEMASWHGTDVFLEKFKDKAELIGGYFSYSKGGLTYCIFFSNAEQPQVLATISFDSSYSPASAKTDTVLRSFDNYEKDIYVVRKEALNVINNDTLFKTYANTSLNLIPVIDGSSKKVYVLTGPKVSGVVVMGNDYLLTFDKENRLLTKKPLHKNIIPIEYGKQDMQVIGTMHSHLPETGDYITATDICTLMLYQHLAKWQQHIVISENFVSIWDCEKHQLAILPKEAWEKSNRKNKKSK
jgi:hypothetical protein